MTTKEKLERMTTFEVEAAHRNMLKYTERDNAALHSLHPAEQAKFRMERKQYTKEELPEEVLAFSKINRREKGKRRLSAPWSGVDEGTGLSISIAHETMKQGVEVRDSFHHYYKKHMTIVGLKDQLDSSDSDSETSTNYQAKVFCRRIHRPKPAEKPFAEAEKAEAERKKNLPWKYRAPGVEYIGATAQVPKRKGKRSGPLITVPDQPIPPRLSRLERYHHSQEEPRALSSLANPWDVREEAKEKAEKVKRYHFVSNCPESPMRAARIKRAEEGGFPVLRSDTVMSTASATTAGTKASKKKRSMSSMTVRKMDDSIRRIKLGHQEAMQRHRMIMEAVDPISPEFSP